MLIKALNIGLVGSILAILLSFLLLIVAKYVLISMYLPIAIDLNYHYYFYAFISGIIISLVSAFSPIIKTLHVDIVGKIKYE